MTSTGVHVRHARAHDTAAMLHITRNVWEGHDYVPYVWETWLKDGCGYLSVAEMESLVVGLMHVTVQNDGTAWMEGIRVREDIQARGIGRALLEDGIRWVREAGCPRLRLSTYGGNPSSNRVASKAGLQEIARVRALSGDVVAPPDSAGTCRLAYSWDIDRIWDFLTETCNSRSAPMIYTEGWTAYSLTRERLSVLLGAHAVLVAGEEEVSGVAIAIAKNERPVLRLGLIEGDEAAKEGLVRSVAHQAVIAGLPRMSATVVVDDPLLQALQQIGLTSPKIDEMVIYECELVQGT